MTRADAFAEMCRHENDRTTDRSLDEILSEPPPASDSKTMRKQPGAQWRKLQALSANGRRPLTRNMAARSVGEPYSTAWGLAVAISWRTPTHNLCCASTSPGEVPVTKDELGRALRIFWKQSRGAGGVHRRGHHLCGAFLRALAAMTEDQRAVIRRLVAMQSPER